MKNNFELKIKNEKIKNDIFNENNPFGSDSEVNSEEGEEGEEKAKIDEIEYINIVKNKIDMYIQKVKKIIYKSI